MTGILVATERKDLIVNDPIWHASIEKAQTWEEWVGQYKTQGKTTGLWRIQQTDPTTGEVKKEIWNKNVVTDQGANNMLQRTVNSSGATLPALFNNMLITNASGCTTTTSSISGASITSIPCAALPAAIPSGTNLTLGFGAAISQTVTASASASLGATSITVSSFTASTTYAVGTAVVVQPSVTDNPSSFTATTSYSGALSTGAFVFTPNTGLGNRQVVVTAVFQNSGGTNTTVGNYTDVWIINVSSGATTNNYLTHEINFPMRCDSSNNITCSSTIKI